MANGEKKPTPAATAETPKRGLLARAAEAAGEFVGRMQAETEKRRAESLSERATGRLDATWSARNSGTTRAYEAAVENRGTADWRTALTTGTLAIIEGLDVMLSRSRWMIRNDGYAASAQGAYRRKVVGGGITARASARDPRTGKMLKDFNAAHDLLWNAWAMDPLLCDAEQTKCLYEKQALWMDELFAAGGVLLRAVYTPRRDAVGLAIQELEYEQLDSKLTGYDGHAVFNGVETDSVGAPIAYHVFAAAHPLEETPSGAMRLEASTCWHIFKKTRVRQRLGAVMMAPVMPAMRSLAMYELYTIGKARTEAAYHGFVEKAPGSTASAESIRQRLSGKTPVGSEDEKHLQVRVENGLFPILPADTKVVFPTAGTPNSVYDPFVQTNLKKIAAGTGLDMPTVARWYAEGNFNTQRKAALEMEAETDAIQDLQFINGALRGIRGLWTELAVREGKLKAPGFLTSAAARATYLTTNWQGPPVRSVDPIKDQAAWDMLFRSLRGTPQQYFNERGLDPRDVLAEWEEWFEMAEEHHLGDVVAQFFGTGTANAPKAGMRPDGTGKDADAKDAGGNGSSGKLAGAGGHNRMGQTITDRLVLASLLGEEVAGSQ